MPDTIRPIQAPPRTSDDSLAIGRELYRLEQLHEAYVSYVQHHAIWIGGEPDSYDAWVGRLRSGANACQ